MDRRTCRLAGVVTGALALVALLAIAGSGALASRPAPTAHSAASQAAVAKKLAARVTRAHTPKARYKALLGVMRTLKMGVFTGKGKAIVRAASPHEVYLYDFEVKSMAAGLGRRSVKGLDEVAAPISDLALKGKGKAISGSKLAGAMRAGVRRALKRPRSPQSLVPLLARELGLRHRPAYDLAKAAPAKVRLDPLQAFLVNADVATAVLQHAGKGARTASAVASKNCDNQISDFLKGGSLFAKWVISLVGPVKDYAKIVTLSLDMFHGGLLAFSVGFISTTSENQRTHYGPAGHDSDGGKPMDFGVRLAMLDELPHVLVDCGPLLGMKFPHKGRLPGVTILWKDESAFGAPLDDHGTTSYPKGRQTDSNGEVVLHFEPKVEKVPGFGDVKHAANTKTAIALYQSAFNNIPGSVAQFLTPKSASFAWNVGFHLPRGFKVAGMVHDNDCVMFGQPSCRVDVDIHVCGDDPFAPWDGTISRVSEGDTLTTDVIWAFVPGVATSPVDKQYGYPQTSIDGRHQIEAPYQTIFTTAGSGGRQGPYTLPMEEDKTCPDNTPVGSG